MNEPRNLNSVEEILDFAVEKETEAFQFYSDWAGKVENGDIAEVLLGFAPEEKKHRALITEVREGKKIPPSPKEITDLSISDYLVDAEPSEDMDYQKALMVAMQREKSAFRLYTELAAKVGDANVKILFQTLAQEEARHKLRLETIYDDEILSEN